MLWNIAFWGGFIILGVIGLLLIGSMIFGRAPTTGSHAPNIKIPPEAEEALRQEIRRRDDYYDRAPRA
jgi:hypothetical protein